MSAPALEEIVARVRARLDRTRAHLRAALAGRDTDLLYVWGVYPEEGGPQTAASPRDWRPSPGAHFHPASRRGLAYLTVNGEIARRISEAIDNGEYGWAGPAAYLDHERRETRLLAPEGLPRRMTIAEALARLDTDGEHLVAATGAEIRDYLALVTPKLRAAVGARPELVTRWPWPWHSPLGRLLAGLIARGDIIPSGELAPGAWPADVAPLHVVAWAAPLLKKAHPETAAALRALAEEWRTAGRPEQGAPTWTVALAVLYATLQAVERDRGRPAVAIDAGRPHHDLLMGWRDLPKDTRTPHHVPAINHRIELLAPGRSVQLTLDLDLETGTMSEALILALRDWRGWKGLRHWAALHKLLSVEGGRAGWVRWTLDGHLDALGTRIKHRSETARRASVARQVEAFTHLELAAYAADGTLRERKPLLLVGAKYDRLQGSEWKLDGMQLTINPLLYSGVREAGGRLGRNWHPAPVELAAVDDKHHPYTLALGLILPIRWRLALEEGRDHITLKGLNALALAGITYRARNQGAAWKALERDLAELHRIGGLGRWEWDAADTPRTLAGRLHLWPADWMVDRTLHDVRPRELQPGPAVLTGAELKAWRTDRRLTQTKAAKQIGTSRRTIARAEAHALEPLSSAVAAKIRAAEGGG